VKTAQSYSRTLESSDENDTTYYIAEQVQREPVASAFYISNPSRGVVHEGYVEMIPKFKQAHVHVNFLGQRKTILTHPEGLWNETYFSDIPDLMIRLLRMHTELGGTVNVTCPTTGYIANIQFRDKPIFGGSKNQLLGRITIHGKHIFGIEGAWDDIIYLTNPTTKERYEFFNRNTYMKQKVESYPLEEQPETSGEKVWGPLIDLLLKEDFEQAKIVKAELDLKGQQELQDFEKNGGFVPSYFHKNPTTGSWELKDTSLVYWQNNHEAQGAQGQPTM